jgi:hypothetical protein
MKPLHKPSRGGLPHGVDISSDFFRCATLHPADHTG